MADPYSEKKDATQPPAEPSAEDNPPAAKPGLLSMATPYADAAVNNATPNAPAAAVVETASESQHLTQTTLEDYWEVMFAPETLATFSEPEKVTNFLKGVKPELGDDGKSVVITLTSSFAEHEVKKVLPEIMSRIRSVSGEQELTPKIVVKAEERAAKPYKSGEKYEAMLKINPALAELRKVLQDIDI